MKNCYLLIVMLHYIKFTYIVLLFHDQRWYYNTDVKGDIINSLKHQCLSDYNY